VWFLWISIGHQSRQVTNVSPALYPCNCYILINFTILQYLSIVLFIQKKIHPFFVICNFIQLQNSSIALLSVTSSNPLILSELRMNIIHQIQFFNIIYPYKLNHLSKIAYFIQINCFQRIEIPWNNIHSKSVQLNVLLIIELAEMHVEAHSNELANLLEL